MVLFQSPSGDSLFSDPNLMHLYLQDNQLSGFNPLAGIRCFLTLSSEFPANPTAVVLSVVSIP